MDDDETPIPPTPDLYTQFLQKIGEAAKGADGNSAYEITVEHGFVGTEEQWLKSLKGEYGKTPDMSEYPKTSEVTTIIEREIAPVADEAHTHDNKAVLNSITDELLEAAQPNPPATDDGITVEVTVDGNKYSGKLNNV